VTTYLPIGTNELLTGAVETSRLECKATWDETTSGPQILKTLCAFANDLQNLNGGYVLIGVAEQDGALVRPVRGIEKDRIDAAQKWITGNCNRIDPIYMPVCDVVEVDGKQILVLWAPASDTRPHQAPDGAKGERKYWIRVGSETVAAKAELLTALMQQTARVPFDDRRATGATNADLSLTLVRQFLNDIHSALLEERDAELIYRRMQIVSPINGHSIPRNIGLLFFSNDPGQWFRGARIEVVEFHDDAGGDVLTEHAFTGPIHEQVRRCLSHLESLTSRHLEKQNGVAETRGWLSFPIPALREALVNAVYHRSYEESVEPTKIYLYPNRIEVISYPGPVLGLELRHLERNVLPPPLPARNRRIGEFLKELRLAESRGTGVPKIRRTMVDNGSPPPRFDFDESRSYFRVTLPAHPEYVVLSILRDYAYAKATGNYVRAAELLTQAWADGVRSASLLVAMVREFVEQRNLAAADQLIDQIAPDQIGAYARALTILADAHADVDDRKRSKELLNRLPELLAPRDAFEAAILERRLDRNDRAHRLFERAGDLVLQDVRALHEFAQSKLQLTRSLHKSKRPSDQQVCRRLLSEALIYLERVVQMDAPDKRHAWAWFNIGQARQWLHQPRQEVVEAYQRAVSLDSTSERFRAALARAQTSEAGGTS
jgi:ATP-dependent DNA helicase RecG